MFDLRVTFSDWFKGKPEELLFGASMLGVFLGARYFDTHVTHVSFASAQRCAAGGRAAQRGAADVAQLVAELLEAVRLNASWPFGWRTPL